MESQVNVELVRDRFSNWNWKTKEGKLILISEMADSHLRNAALVLMGLGYQKVTLDNKMRVLWLTALRVEWERRMLARVNGLAKWKG